MSEHVTWDGGTDECSDAVSPEAERELARLRRQSRRDWTDLARASRANPALLGFRMRLGPQRKLKPDPVRPDPTEPCHFRSLFGDPCPYRGYDAAEVDLHERVRHRLEYAAAHGG